MLKGIAGNLPFRNAWMEGYGFPLFGMVTTEGYLEIPTELTLNYYLGN